MQIVSPETWRSPLYRGIGIGDDVFSWQAVLGRITKDGDFGRGTEKSTIQWQLARGLTGDGRVGRATRAHIQAMPTETTLAFTAVPLIRVPLAGEPGAERWPFIQAVTWKWLDRKAIRLICVHTMEAPEKPDIAEAVAAWFGGLRGTPPLASAHLCVDQNSAVRCVLARHGAAAAPGANTDGYHIEHGGFARQSAEEWKDAASSSMLGLSAEQSARVTMAYAIPIRKLSVTEVADGVTKGFCGHHDVTLAFRKSTHVDPGEHFPWDDYLGRVESWTKRLAA